MTNGKAAMHNQLQRLEGSCANWNVTTLPVLQASWIVTVRVAATFKNGQRESGK